MCRLFLWCACPSLAVPSTVFRLAPFFVLFVFAYVVRVRMLDGPGMRAQEIANLAWALAVMGEADVELLGELLRSAQAQRGDFTLIESHQLYQVCA